MFVSRNGLYDGCSMQRHLGEAFVARNSAIDLVTLHSISGRSKISWGGDEMNS